MNTNSTPGVVSRSSYDELANAAKKALDAIEANHSGYTMCRANEALRKVLENPPATKPSPNHVLSVLEQLVQHGTEMTGQALVLMYDKEDGFWISTVDCGCRHYPVKDLGDEKSKTLFAAVVAAVKWHNKQGEKRYMNYLKKLAEPVDEQARELASLRAIKTQYEDACRAVIWMQDDKIIKDRLLSEGYLGANLTTKGVEVLRQELYRLRDALAGKNPNILIH